MIVTIRNACEEIFDQPIILRLACAPRNLFVATEEFLACRTWIDWRVALRDLEAEHFVLELKPPSLTRFSVVFGIIQGIRIYDDDFVNREIVSGVGARSSLQTFVSSSTRCW